MNSADKRRHCCCLSDLAITVYIQVTDAGSEQVACRKTVHEDVRLRLTLLHFSDNCLQHQQHLGFKSTLRVSEFILTCVFLSPLGYYSSLAKLGNVWREIGLQIYEEWAQQSGALEANSVAKRAPNKCLSGRLGLCAKC